LGNGSSETLTSCPSLWAHRLRAELKATGKSLLVEVLANLERRMEGVERPFGFSRPGAEGQPVRHADHFLFSTGDGPVSLHLLSSLDFARASFMEPDCFLQKETVYSASGYRKQCSVDFERDGTDTPQTR
jgi:hypothetical protein